MVHHSFEQKKQKKNRHFSLVFKKVYVNVVQHKQKRTGGKFFYVVRNFITVLQCDLAGQILGPAAQLH